VSRMTRENSAGSEMSKLLSFGYLETPPQSSDISRKSSAGTNFQSPSSAGTRYHSLNNSDSCSSPVALDVENMDPIAEGMILWHMIFVCTCICISLGRFSGS